ncbi:Rpn family recombination-promoting nuclease/putative transposase, partial [Treponema sp.]|uniref:Rpn family recombination-promoting nuclease/putative transposase n=1 Tax=Treponema sp. TaxID=166 RepID=UPI00298E8398
MEKRFEDLTFADDGMFQAVLRDPAISAELVELLLGVQVDHVEYPELEKVIEPFYTSKGVRLDVYLKDENKVIDVELQCYKMAELGKRMRYYEAMVDIDSLMKGQTYDKLKESYILFICKFDPFVDKDGKPFGLPCYTFRNICKENASVNLNDKSHKVVYNASAYESEKNERIKALLRYIQTDESGEDDFSRRLDALVSKLKESENFKREYMLMNLHDYDILRKGREEGAQQKAVEDAVMLVKDFNVEPKLAAEKMGA